MELRWLGPDGIEGSPPLHACAQQHERVSDLALVSAELDVLWGVNERGRITGPVEFALAVATAGPIAAAAADHIPDSTAAALSGLVDDGPPIDDPRTPPPVMAQCREILADLGATYRELTLTGGPSYLVPPSIGYPISAPILRSDSAHTSVARALRPPNWAPEEWADLVRGGEGAPWAMVVVNQQIVSICHTPRRTSQGAEAGAWTDSRFRGRGYAAATTASWADVIGPDCPHRFYSTAADNASSQRVAKRLGLREIGWIWKLTRPRAQGHEQPDPNTPRITDAARAAFRTD